MIHLTKTHGTSHEPLKTNNNINPIKNPLKSWFHGRALIIPKSNTARVPKKKALDKWAWIPRPQDVPNPFSVGFYSSSVLSLFLTKKS